jgi:hypothetical protein
VSLCVPVEGYTLSKIKGKLGLIVVIEEASKLKKKMKEKRS